MSLARTLTYTYLAVLALVAIDESAARVSDDLHAGVPLLAAPDFTADLVIRDSLGTRGRPNGRFEKWVLNSAGFRSPESVLAPKSGCTRVMTLGSSETFGLTGESAGQEYPAQLADSLASGGCFQVINAGMAGIGLPSMIQLWTHWASRFHPDIVVIIPNPILYLGDAPPVADTTHPHAPPWWTLRMGMKLREAVPEPAWLAHWIASRELDDMTATHPAGWTYSTIPQDRLSLFRHDLDSLLEAVWASGGRPVLAAAPIMMGTHIQPGDAPFVDGLRLFSPRTTPEVALAFDSAATVAVRDVGRQTGAPVVDLPAAMNGRRDLFDDAIHYTNAGASVVAGKVAVVVRREAGGR